MDSLNARERYYAVLRGEPGVRTLNWEFGYWTGTIERWYLEGLRRGAYSHPMGYPEGNAVFAEVIPWPPRIGNVHYRDLDVATALGFDPGAVRISVNWRYSPAFEPVIYEEDELTRTMLNTDGVKVRVRKNADSLPQFLAWPVYDMASWEKLKEERMSLDTLMTRFPDRWDQMGPTYRNRDFPLGVIVDGFFSLPRELIGVEHQLMLYYTDPDLFHAIGDHVANLWIAMFEEIFSKTDLDFVYFWEDMSFNTGPLISPAMFQTFCAPYYRRVTDYLKGRGVEHRFIDTDGNCWLLIPEFLKVGINGMYPFEVQSGMDVTEVRKKFPELKIIGGINKRSVAEGKAAIDAELEAKLPYMLSQGRYIPTCDHLVHPEVSWKNYEYFRRSLTRYIKKDHSKISHKELSSTASAG
jgi:uroporphyrinogen-III decarboxylase